MSRLVPQAFDLSPNPVQKVEGDLVAQCEGAAGVGVVFACGKVAFGMGLDLALFSMSLSAPFMRMHSMRAVLRACGWRSAAVVR